MKKILTIVFIGALGIGICGLVQGCATTTTGKIIQSEGVIITSVDTGMMMWRDQVVAGKATQAQVDTVHKYYDVYYTAQLTAKGALEAYVAHTDTNEVDVVTANTAVANAETALLNLLNQYIVKK